MKTRITLDIEQIEASAEVFKAMSLPLRLEILKFLLQEKREVNITDLAKQFDLPVSSAAFHIKMLEKAKLIAINDKPGQHGSQKICSLLAEDVYFGMFGEKDNTVKTRIITYSMPVGNYFDYLVTPSCGMAGSQAPIGNIDFIDAFHHPDRLQAQLIWFSTGFLEYYFPNYNLRYKKLIELIFSFEVCSETPGYNNDWPSDITIWINSKDVFTFRSAGDFGGTGGKYTPGWWKNGTQYGELHTLKIDHEGCYGDGRKTSDQTLETLAVTEGEHIVFRIGIKNDAEYPGGINLFGERFGNYQQNIEMRAIMEP